MAIIGEFIGLLFSRSDSYLGGGSLLAFQFGERTDDVDQVIDGFVVHPRDAGVFEPLEENLLGGLFGLCLDAEFLQALGVYFRNFSCHSFVRFNETIVI